MQKEKTESEGVGCYAERRSFSLALRIKKEGIHHREFLPNFKNYYVLRLKAVCAELTALAEEIRMQKGKTESEGVDCYAERRSFSLALRHKKEGIHHREFLPSFKNYYVLRLKAVCAELTGQIRVVCRYKPRSRRQHRECDHLRS